MHISVKNLILLAACCGEKVHIQKNKSLLLLVGCMLLNDVLSSVELDEIGKFGSENMHIQKVHIPV